MSVTPAIDLRQTARSTKESATQVDQRPIEKNIDWKNPLVMGLSGRSEMNIKADKVWSLFAENIKKHCPETAWFFIHEDGTVEDEPGYIKSIHTWVKALIASPEWPFPEQVIVMSEIKNNKRSWKVIFPKVQKRLPYCEPPRGLTVIPYRDKFSGGWRIIPETTFENEKAGEA